MGYLMRYDDNPLQHPGAWSILPGIADMKGLVPHKGITLERQAATMWYGVMVYQHPRNVEVTRWVAFLGSIWGTGSNIQMILFDRDPDALIRRVEATSWFKGEHRFSGGWIRDDRVTGEWEDAP